MRCERCRSKATKTVRSNVADHNDERLCTGCALAVTLDRLARTELLSARSDTKADGETMYRCVFVSRFRIWETHNRHLNVRASDALEAIAELRSQLRRERETLVKIVSVCPAALDPSCNH